MNSFEEKLKTFIKENKIACEHLHFEQSCHTVAEAAAAVGTQTENFVKNVCFVSNENELVVAIVLGNDKVDVKKVSDTMDANKLTIATKEEVLSKTTYPAGGVPSFGYNAKFVIDTKVMGKNTVYSGGGSENALVKINPYEMQRINQAKTANIIK